MEIYTYVPAALLKKAPEEMDIDEFIETIAQAKYIQGLRIEEIASGVSKVFGE